MFLTQARPSGHEFTVDGPLLTPSSDVDKLKINGQELPARLDASRSVLTLGDSDVNYFRQGLNSIESAAGKLLYWREENHLTAFKVPYKSSFAILAAIDDYDRLQDSLHRSKTGFHQLSGMVARTEELKTALMNVGFPADNIITLYDQQATSEALEGALRKFWKGGEHSDIDRLFVYFGGHGEGYPGGVRLVTYDYMPDRPSLTSFDARELPEGQSRNLTAHHVMFALDVCHAGLSIYRHLGDDKASEEHFERLSVIRADVEPSARNILVAGTEGQDALWENGGIFTAALVLALQGAADPAKTGVITFDQLAVYVRNSVIARASSTGFRQDPTGKVLDEFGPGQVVFIPGISADGGH